MPERPQRIGIYCRLSYTEDGDEEKVDRQERDCRELAGKLRWPVSDRHVFKDNNRSAWQRHRKRPGWDCMLTAVENDEIDGVVVYHGDRLIRQPWDLELLLKLADDRQLALASPSGVRDLNNEDDRFILRIEAAQACRESANTSRRVRRGLKARAGQGLPRPGGTRAFGFERDNITIREAEAEVIREAAARILAGQSLYSVTRWANTKTRTPTGGRWETTAFRDMLVRPRHAGLLVVDEEFREAAWLPVIERATWEMLRVVLQRRRKSSNQGQEFVLKYLLSNIARCGSCDEALTVTNTGGRHRKTPGRAYRCDNPECERRVRRSVPHLDAYVEGRVLRILNDPAFLDRLHQEMDAPGTVAEIASLEQRRAEAKQQLENLADFPGLDAAMVARSLGSFDRKIEELRAQMAATERQRTLSRLAGVTREQWAAEPLDVRRATVRWLVTVRVHRTEVRGRGFDPATVDVTPIDAA